MLEGLRAYEKGPESVEDLIAGALGHEKARYEKRLNFLATLASNAPYIGLFGTVLGIVRSFRDLAANMAEASARGDGRHRRGADRHRGRPAGGHPGGHRLQRLQGPGQGRGHQLPAAGADPAGAAEVDGRASRAAAE